MPSVEVADADGRRAEIEPSGPGLIVQPISSSVSVSSPHQTKEPSKGHKFWDRWLDSWFPELLGCFLAGALLVAACVVLAVANNKPITWWPWNWQINSGLALITALMEACLLFPLTSCLGQLSWLSYRTNQEEPQRELVWFDRIAHAYTPLGAISFLSHKTAWRNWSILGSVTVILLLGTGLFTQNVVTQRLVTVSLPNDQAIVLVTQNYDIFTADTQYMATPLMESSMLTGLAAGTLTWAYVGDNSFKSAIFYCPTSNCTYDVYTTLNICSTCLNRNLTVELQQDNLQRDFWTMPNSTLTLANETALVNFTADTRYPESSWWTDQDIGPLLVHYQVFARENVSMMPEARECVAYWCVTAYNATARSGYFSEDRHIYTTPEDFKYESEVIHSFTNTSAAARTYYDQPENITIIPPRSWLNGTEQTDDVSMRTFTVSADAQRSLQNSLLARVFSGQGLLGGSITLGTNGSGQYTSSLAAHLMFNRQDPYEFENFDSTELYSDPEFSFTNLTHYMGLAVRMGETSGYWWSFGMTETDTYHLHIRWAWMAYPIAMVALVFGFVGITWFRSRGEKRWKSSVLPVLVHGLNDDRVAGTMTSPAVLRKEARHIKAQLQETEDGRLVWKTANRV
ncbi:hypothetical protein Q7P37_008465 [Cladosporium fusiforme]